MNATPDMKASSFATTTFAVNVRDNVRGGNPEESHKAGNFTSYEEAVAVCRGRLDIDLKGYHKPGMTSEELVEEWGGLGETPIVAPEPPERHFSPRGYAEERAREICAEEDAVALVPRFAEAPPELVAMRAFAREAMIDTSHVSKNEARVLRRMVLMGIDELPNPPKRVFTVRAILNMKVGTDRAREIAHEFVLTPRSCRFASNDEGIVPATYSKPPYEGLECLLHLFGTGRRDIHHGSPLAVIKGFRIALGDPKWTFVIGERSADGAAEGDSPRMRRRAVPREEARENMEEIRANVDFILEHLGEIKVSEKIRRGVEGEVRVYWAILAEPLERIGAHMVGPSGEGNPSNFLADLKELGRVLDTANPLMDELVTRLNMAACSEGGDHVDLALLVMESATNILNANTALANIRSSFADTEKS